LNLIFISFPVQNRLTLFTLQPLGDAGTHLLEGHLGPAVKFKNEEAAIYANRLRYLARLEFRDCCFDVGRNIRVSHEEAT